MNGLKLLVLPGWANSGPGHWQTFWEKSLPNARRIYQDNWREPHKQAWVKRLNEEISKEHEPLVLVCHSLGCWLAAHWAIEHPDLAKAKVRFALLVAPPDLARTNDELWAGMKVFVVFLSLKNFHGHWCRLGFRFQTQSFHFRLASCIRRTIRIVRLK